MKKYLLLGSRIALGVYVPALSVKKQLEARGCRTDLLCLEDLYRGRDAMIEKSKKSMHRDFRLARASYRFPTRNRKAVDPEEETRLLSRLHAVRYDAVITFSGFWAGFLNELILSCAHYEGRVFAIHMDAGYSLSWKGADTERIREIWLYHLERNTISCLLEEPDPGRETQESGTPEADSPDRRSPERGSSGKDGPAPEIQEGAQPRRILVHGGGWGIGDYKGRISRLNELGYRLDIIIYYPEELDAADEMNRYYLLDPDWKPDDRKEEYPPLLQYSSGRWAEPEGSSRRDRNPLRRIMQQASAVLSKPGGGTLADSLTTATPLLFAEELSAYERENKLLWIKKGLGTDFEEFVSARDRDALLDRMRRNLLLLHRTLPRVIDAIFPKEV